MFPSLSTKYAATIVERIRIAVRDFQDELRPPIDTTSAVRLSPPRRAAFETPESARDDAAAATSR